MKSHAAIELVESRQLRTGFPVISSGDTVAVSVRVREGERQRIQVFEGIVLAVRHRGLNTSFIVRKISYGVGVERTFQLHSQSIDSIEIKRRGDVRKAKIYYLRERSGRSARIRERLKARPEELEPVLTMDEEQVALMQDAEQGTQAETATSEEQDTQDSRD